MEERQYIDFVNSDNGICGEVEISHDEVMALQNMGIPLMSDMEIVAELESNLEY